MRGAVLVCGPSPLETGCTGNPCRVPRRQQGGQKRGAAEPIDAGSGAAAPVRDRARGRWQRSRRNGADPRPRGGWQVISTAGLSFFPIGAAGAAGPERRQAWRLFVFFFPSAALARRPPRSRLAAPRLPVTGMTTARASAGLDFHYGLTRQCMRQEGQELKQGRISIYDAFKRPGLHAGGTGVHGSCDQPGGRGLGSVPWHAYRRGGRRPAAGSLAGTFSWPRTLTLVLLWR